MARPIRETPILFGEDARRFIARMQERHPETPEARAQRLRDYEFFLKAFERGMAKSVPARLQTEVWTHGSNMWNSRKI